jgi:hypothetical protein
LGTENAPAIIATSDDVVEAELFQFLGFLATARKNNFPEAKCQYFLPDPSCVFIKSHRGSELAGMSD